MRRMMKKGIAPLATGFRWKHGLFAVIMLTLASLVNGTAARNFQLLLALYENRIRELKFRRFWKRLETPPQCNYSAKPPKRCVDINCKDKLPTKRNDKLQRVLDSMDEADSQKLDQLMKTMKSKPTGKRVLFLTAASSNHYLESQALLKTLHEDLFQKLDNFSLVYYDIGLTPQERSQVKKYCRCEVRLFPQNLMADWMKKLICYTWKPLIVQANIHAADIVIWMDASVRLGSKGFLKTVENLQAQGVIINGKGQQVAQNIDVQMMNYFQTSSCVYPKFNMLQANFILFHNDVFVRDVIVKPWAVCALRRDCMCPKGSIKMCDLSISKYGKCHRYDQAALTIILLTLFDTNINTLYPTHLDFAIKRNHVFRYFQSLRNESFKSAESRS